MTHGQVGEGQKDLTNWIRLSDLGATLLLQALGRRLQWELQVTSISNPLGMADHPSTGAWVTKPLSSF